MGKQPTKETLFCMKLFGISDLRTDIFDECVEHAKRLGVQR